VTSLWKTVNSDLDSTTFLLAEMGTHPTGFRARILARPANAIAFTPVFRSEDTALATSPLATNPLAANAFLYAFFRRRLQIRWASTSFLPS
jgi:hypothetical protein